MQKDLGRLEKWPDRNFMQFNKDIQQVQQLGIKSPPSNTTGWGWLNGGAVLQTQPWGKRQRAAAQEPPWPKQQLGPTAGTEAQVLHPEKWSAPPIQHSLDTTGLLGPVWGPSVSDKYQQTKGTQDGWGLENLSCGDSSRFSQLGEGTFARESSSSCPVSIRRL